MDYHIASDIFDAHPRYRRGLVVLCNANNCDEGSRLEPLLRAEEEHLRHRWGTGPVAERAEIACWREAYRRFGAKPSEHRSSIEAMDLVVEHTGAHLVAAAVLSANNPSFHVPPWR